MCDEASVCRPIELGVADNPAGSDPISWRRIDPTIGYIRVEDSLGDSNTVAAFDAALAGLRDVRGLVLDLRMTPSGGDTEVAEPMLGRFIAKTSGYQRVFEPRPGRRFPDDSWVKTLSPRGPWVVEQDLVVLVDRWTGSMGEGMAIGLDALGRAEVVGTRMAGLLGGVGTFKLPRTGVVVRFPIERLYHVNGTPREAFVPRIVVDAGAVGGDPVLEAGLAALRARLARAPQVGVPGSQ